MFARSTTAAAMKRAYTKLPGVASTVMALVARSCIEGVPQGQRLPLPPPGHGQAFGVRTPHGALCLFVDEEKGIQWLFPSSWSPSHRETLWTGFADLVDAAHLMAQAKGGVEKQGGPISPHQWWDYAYGQMSATESKGESYAAFACLFHGMGAPLTTVDALGLRDGKTRFVEFPTGTMMRHHEAVLRRRMESQAALMSALTKS